MKKANKEVSVEEAGKRLNEAFECMEDYKASGLKSTALMQDVKLNVKEREANRLAVKYGGKSVQATKARAKVDYSKTARVGIAEEVQRNAYKAPRFEADSWRIQGRVMDLKNNGIDNLTISLFNKEGKWIKDLGQDCTRDKGYFSITFTDKTGGKVAKKYQGQPLTLTVSDSRKRVLHQEKEPLFIELGKIDSRLIVLGEDQCEIPPETVDDRGDDGAKDKPVVKTKPEDLERKWTVKGTVSDAKSGKALQGLTVSLYDRELLFDKELGTVTTTKTGEFEMSYHEKEFKKLFAKNPDIYLKVMDKSGKTLYTSRTKMQATVGKEELLKLKILRKGKS